MAAAIATVISLAAQPAIAAGPEPCIEDWSAISTAVKANGLISPRVLEQQAKGKIEGRLIKVGLCGSPGDFSYKLTILAPGGRVVTQSVDAKTPFGE
jgi:uncharacterized membrane protein YkoI